MHFKELDKHLVDDDSFRYICCRYIVFLKVALEAFHLCEQNPTAGLLDGLLFDLSFVDKGNTSVLLKSLLYERITCTDDMCMKSRGLVPPPKVF